MRSCIDLFCLPFRLNRPSRTKRSNVRTVRELLRFLSQADNETNQVVNTILRKILAELFNQNNISPPTCFFGEDTAQPILDQHILKELASALSRTAHDPLGVLTSGRSPVRTQSSFPTEVADAYGSRNPPGQELVQIHIQQNLLHRLFSQCSTALLELIFQMEAVKNWSALVRASQLNCHDMSFEPPVLHPPHCSVSTGGRVRIASWNLNRFTLDKAKHPGFRETLCLTVFRAQISLLVLQEVANLDVVNILCSELNNPTLPHIKQWLSQHPPDHLFCWEAATSIHSTGTMFRSAEYAVFLYDKLSGIRIKRTHLLERSGPEEANNVPKALRIFSRSPCPALCTIRDERFVIVSVHLKAQGLRNSRIGKTVAEVQALECLVQAFNDTQPAGTHLIIVGDFNLNPDHEAFEGLRSKGLSSILNGNQSTTVGGTSRTSTVPNSRDTTSRYCSTAYDNAWISTQLTTSVISSSACFTGDCGVIMNGLKHPLIPDSTGAGANGFISDHCPIWFDLIVP